MNTLNELQGYKRFNNHDLETLLRQNNFTYIRNGRNCLVALGKNAAFKFYYDDDAYNHFLNLLETAPTEFKSFLPKLYSVKTFQHWKAVKLEKLKPLSDNDAEILESIFYYKLNHNKPFEYYKELDNLYAVISNKNNFVKFINWIIQNVNKYWLDMHGGNFMVNLRNELILIDPYAE